MLTNSRRAALVVLRIHGTQVSPSFPLAPSMFMRHPFSHVVSFWHKDWLQAQGELPYSSLGMILVTYLLNPVYIGTNLLQYNLFSAQNALCAFSIL